MQTIYFISIGAFILASFLDLRSSADYPEANPLMRGKDGKISKVKFVLGMVVVLALSTFAAYRYAYWGGVVINCMGIGVHIFAVIHNNKVKRKG